MRSGHLGWGSKQIVRLTDFSHDHSRESLQMKCERMAMQHALVFGEQGFTTEDDMFFFVQCANLNYSVSVSKD